MDRSGTSKLELLEQAFSPAAPITSENLFLGRLEQIQKTCDAINERGNHFAIFGERGVGKTSLANIIANRFTNVIVSKTTCNREESFKGLWAKALARVDFVSVRRGAGFIPHTIEEPKQLNLFLPSTEDIDSLDVQSALEQVRTNLLFVFDEFDSVTSPKTRARFADTIKALSDNAPHVTVGFVGIASNVDELIGRHRSVERCLKQIRMPKMSSDEIRDIIRKGLDVLDLRMKPDVADSIVTFSSGFPHYAHLLSKSAARAAIHQGSRCIDGHHYRQAVSSAVEDVDQSIRTAYRIATVAATTSSRFEEVLGACALCRVDQFGTFAAKDIVEPYAQLATTPLATPALSYSLQKLTEPDRGAVLTRLGRAQSIRYRFSNPLMRMYILMLLTRQGRDSTVPP